MGVFNNHTGVTISATRWRSRCLCLCSLQSRTSSLRRWGWASRENTPEMTGEYPSPSGNRWLWEGAAGGRKCLSHAVQAGVTNRQPCLYDKNRSSFREHPVVIVILPVLFRFFIFSIVVSWFSLVTCLCSFLSCFYLSVVGFKFVVFIYIDL